MHDFAEHATRTFRQTVEACTDTSVVLRWNRQHLTYGEPSAIHTALEAFDVRVANCIGFAHLPAALLRNLGIPARVVRTFMVHGPHLTRHYLLEVYYPEDDQWLTFEPQTVSQPAGTNLFLYADADWNQDVHRITRAFSVDTRTHVLAGRRAEARLIHETDQLAEVR